MNKKAWDDYDQRGREHARHLKRALTMEKRAVESGDAASADAWSQVAARHSRKILELIQLKRQIALDTFGSDGWQKIHDPEEIELKKKLREQDRENMSMLARF